MKFVNSLCRRRPVSLTAGAVGALAMIVSAHGELNVEVLDGTKVTRLIVNAGDGSVTRGTVATGSLGPAVIYDSEPTEYISGCWDFSCAVGFADELRFANFPQSGGELSSYTFSYATGYGTHFGYCDSCMCYDGNVDPPYTVTAALYDGPPSPDCGGGWPIPGTEVQFQTNASRPLGDRRIEVRVDLAAKLFVPAEVWGVVTFDIQDAWMSIGTSPVVGSSPGSGAQWEDNDEDGCKGWDCWEGPHPWGCPGCDWATFDAVANAQIVRRWQPVLPPASTKHSATVTYTVQGNEAILQKGGEPVWMEIRVSDFDPNQTGVVLKAWQTGVDSSGYASGLQGTLGPFRVPCTSPFGEPDPDCQGQLGPGSLCNHPSDPVLNSCAPGFRDIDRTDYIFLGQIASQATDLSTPNYRWASTLFTGDPIPSPGGESYLGTLVLFVLPDAKGTFEIGFLRPPDCALINGNNGFTPLLGLVPGKITVEVGACCFGLGAADDKAGCVDGMTANQCENVGICKGYCQDDPAIRCGSNLVPFPRRFYDFLRFAC